jgi:hypothetical protein
LRSTRKGSSWQALQWIENYANVQKIASINEVPFSKRFIDDFLFISSSDKKLEKQQSYLLENF